MPTSFSRAALSVTDSVSHCHSVTSKYTEGVFPTDEQTNPHNSCNRTEDSFSHTAVRPAVSALPLVVIELDCQGGQEYLRYSKPELRQDKY